MTKFNFDDTFFFYKQTFNNEEFNVIAEAYSDEDPILLTKLPIDYLVTLSGDEIYEIIEKSDWEIINNYTKIML